MNVSSAMESTTVTGLAADNDYVIGIVPFVVGLVVVAMLIGAVWWGLVRRRREPPPPRPDEQPKPPDHRTHIDEYGPHSYTDFPKDGRRLMPYELKDHGNEVLRPMAPPPPDKEQQHPTEGSRD